MWLKGSEQGQWKELRSERQWAGSHIACGHVRTSVVTVAELGDFRDSHNSGLCVPISSQVASVEMMVA